MFITRFNRFFDRHSRIIYVGLGLVISLSFVVFVIPGSMSDLFGRSGRRGGAVGKMYGKTIDYDTFMDHLRLADLSNFLRTGEFMQQDSSKEGQLVSETLRRMRMLREARSRGLDVVSREELADVLRRIFSRDGIFDKDLFDAFQANVLERNGMSGADLDEAVRQNIIIARLEADIYGAIYVSPNEASDLYDQQNEQFVIRYASFPAQMSEHGNPTEEEIASYFNEHRESLRGSDKRRVRVAQFAPTAFTDEVTVTDEDVASYYERLKGSSFKDKSLDQVRGDIKDLLTRQKARKLAGDAARAFAAAIQDGLGEDLTAEQRAEAFKEAALENDATVKDTGAFSETGVVPNIGKFPIFQRRAYAVSEDNPVSDLIYDAGRYFVVCWLETIPGDVPEELDDDVRNMVSERILEEEARALYAEKVAPYREPLRDMESVWELTQWYDQQLDEQPELSEEEKEKRREAFREQVRTYISPYFVQRQKKVRLVSFDPDDFKPAVEVSEEAIQDDYEENLATYQKEEVRARKIVIQREPGAAEEDEAEKRQTIQTVLKQLREGTPFQDLVEAYSEDADTKDDGGDTGFFARGANSPAVDEAAFSMEPGQISDIIETPNAFVILKLEEKRAGKSLADVRDEIRRKLMGEGAGEKAVAAAQAFSEAVYDAVLEADAVGADAADIMQRMAAENDLQTVDTQFFTSGGVMTPVGYEPELSGEAFKLTEASPVSEAIEGKSNVFVAAWLATTPPELPVLEENERLLSRVVGRVKRDRAIAVAREQAKAAYQKLAAALAEDGSLDDAAEKLEGVEFTTTEPFTRNQPPSGMPEARAILEQLTDKQPGTLLEPIESTSGATIVYLDSRILPAEGEIDAQLDRFENQVSWSKRYLIVQDFYNRLEEQSDTVLNEPWRSQLDAPAPR